MKFDFFFIPGLGMNVDEVSLPQSGFGLQNPGFSSGEPEIFSQQYTLEDVAKYHLETILKKFDPEKPLTLAGMSLGGMVLSIIAATYGNLLPSGTRFVFYVTSANSKSLPLLDKETLMNWSKTKPGCLEDFSKILKPFFSPEYLAQNPQEFGKYVEYRTTGKNKQSPKSYFSQLAALLKFEGDRYFSAVDTKSSTFVYGERDSLVNGAQAHHLKSLIPNAAHFTIPHMGHMINLERPEIIKMKGVCDEFQKIPL